MKYITTQLIHAVNSHDNLTSLIAGIMIIVDLKMASHTGKVEKPYSNCCNFPLQSNGSPGLATFP